MKRIALTTILLSLILGNFANSGKSDERRQTGASMGGQNAKLEKAIFAGGCFWCMEPPFEKLDGVTDVVAGYAGGSGENPTYDNYAKKGHVEAVEITYDPSKIGYAELLDAFWKNIDPTDPDGQFVDRGTQYRTVIFYRDEEQKVLAEKSKVGLDRSGKYPKPIVTEIVKVSQFYKAEEYHQDYHKKHPIRYKFYRSNSGRHQYLKKIWGDYSGHTSEKRSLFKV